jgi:DNA-binding CsgD family transcriptional regulator
MHALALHISGDLPRAESVLREAYRDASSRQHLRLEAQRGLALGFTLLESGKIEESIKYFEFTPTYFVGWPLWHDRALINRVLASSYLPHSSDQQTLNINIEGIRSSCYGVYLSLAQAWQAWARADSPEALRILRCAAEQAVSRNAFSDVAVAAHEMARMGFSQYALPYLSVPVQGNFLQARLDYAKALINCNVKLLGKSARAFVEAGAHLYAAEAYTELSQLYKYIGSERASTGAVVLARTHLKKCGDVETFTLRFLGHSSPLTGRERTIADLAARGFSDREIADHLSISPRTVGNTLYRVYRKLGISGRHLLAGRPMEIK